MSFRDEMDHVASALEMESDFAADLPNPYEVFGVSQAVQVQRVFRHQPLTCADEMCDFRTFDGQAWRIHVMNNPGHALLGADE